MPRLPEKPLFARAALLLTRLATRYIVLELVANPTPQGLNKFCKMCFICDLSIRFKDILQNISEYIWFAILRREIERQKNPKLHT